MLALVFDGSLRLVNTPQPAVPEKSALVRVRLAGICNTDLEVTQGYAGYQGILGHEFVGTVEQAVDGGLIGRRVVGEINLSCGACAYCLAGMPTHCTRRTVLGIRDHPGAFAQYLTLPLGNLHLVPDAIGDEEAVFCEPLAAALEVLEQVHIRPSDSVVVLGDGKLGLLVAQVLRLTGCDLLVVGRHRARLDRLVQFSLRTALAGETDAGAADVVVDCTGQAAGLEQARTMVRPRGTIVLKSTYHGVAPLALSPFVVDEVTIVGSRCGSFPAALRLLAAGLVQVRPLVAAEYPLADGVAAFARASEPGVLKVLLRP